MADNFGTYVTYVTYGTALHHGHRYAVTSSPIGVRSVYGLRAWKSGPGTDLVVSIRNPGELDTEAVWHPEFDGAPDSEKAELVAAIEEVFSVWRAEQ